MRFRLCLSILLLLLVAIGCSQLDPTQDSAPPASEQTSSHGRIVCGFPDGGNLEKCDYDILGMQDVAVITIHFNDTLVENRFTEANLETIDSMMFGATNSVHALYDDMSAGTVGFQGGVFGPYTIDYPHDTPCLQKGEMQAAAALLAEADIPGFADYSYYVYVFPLPNDCQDSLQWGGDADGCSGSSLRIWTWRSRSVFAHEFGHMFGFRHSGTYEDGVNVEYGDISCIMATSWFDEGNYDLRLREAGSIWKSLAEWYDPARVTEISDHGEFDFHLAPAERTSDAVVDPEGSTAFQLLKVNYVNSGFIEKSVYISYRHDEGPFYPVAAVAPLMNRVHVHTQFSAGSHTYRVAMLEEGQDYIDGALQITALGDGLSGGGEDFVPIQVTVLAVPPTAILSPTSHLVCDPQAGVIAGTSVMSVTNNAVAGEPDATYTIEPSVQTGFAVVPAVTSITLAPGATVEVSVDIMPDSDIFDGNLPFELFIRDEAGVQGLGRAGGIFKSDLAPPDAPYGLTHELDLGSVILRWEGFYEDTSGIDRYQIMRDGVTISNVDYPMYTDWGATSGETYVYEIRATDNCGRDSDWSVPYEVVIDCAGGSESGLVESTIYANKAKMPFSVVFPLEITNLNEVECGTAEFGYQMTQSVPNPAFWTIPSEEMPLLIAAGETSSVITTMVFNWAPTEGIYEADVTVTLGSDAVGSYLATFCFDRTLPTVPALPEVVVSGTSVDLTWTASTDALAGVDYYEVERDGVIIGTTMDLMFTDAGLSVDNIYTYRVRAYDRAGNVSGWSVGAEANLDITPPTVPTNLSAMVTGGDVDLSWSASTDALSGVDHYEVERDGVIVGTSTNLTYADADLPMDNIYIYRVRAYDGNGNASSWSTDVEANLDVTPPTVPQDVVVANDGCSVDLSWAASTDALSGVAYYEVARDEVVLDQVIDTIFSETLVDPASGATIVYKVRAVDGSGNASAWSETDQFTLPAIVISNVRVSRNSFDCEKTVTWETNIPTSTAVYFGNSCSALTNVDYGTGGTRFHSVVCDVVDLSAFAFQVVSSDGCVTVSSVCQTIPRGYCPKIY